MGREEIYSFLRPPCRLQLEIAGYLSGVVERWRLKGQGYAIGDFWRSTKVVTRDIYIIDKGWAGRLYNSQTVANLKGEPHTQSLLAYDGLAAAVIGDNFGLNARDDLFGEAPKG